MDKAKIPRLYGMNIELTTACPLRCPQCYCSLEGGKHIPLHTAIEALRQAKKMGLQHVELSGGETLCYPYLCELIQEAHSLGINSNIAVSGWHLDKAMLNKLIQSGLSCIFVSLNAPTEELNSRSRDGYQYAISALQLLRESDFDEVHINWVMHRDTANCLPDMIRLAQQYEVKSIVIMTPKPTSRHELHTLPTREQMENVVRLVKESAPGFLKIESCFSPLLALANDSRFMGNMNVGPFKGCGAGRNNVNVSVDGKYSPCRHLEYFEIWDSLEDYWINSEMLKKIRGLEDNKQEPCSSCKYCNYCRHCLAVNSKLNGDLFFGNSLCALNE